MKRVLFCLPLLLLLFAAPARAQELTADEESAAIQEDWSCLCNWPCVNYPYGQMWISFVHRVVCDSEQCYNYPDEVGFGLDEEHACLNAVYNCIDWEEECDVEEACPLQANLQRPSLGPPTKWWPLTEPIPILH